MMNVARPSKHGQPTATRERSILVLASAVARLVDRCECMDTEMRLRFMARLLGRFFDDRLSPGAWPGSSLQAAITEHPDHPELALDRAVELLNRNLRRDQGFTRQSLLRFYDELFALVLPRGLESEAQLSVA